MVVEEKALCLSTSTEYGEMWCGRDSDICGLASFHTSIPVPQEVSIDVVDVGVDGGTTGDAARGHIGVILWVDVLKALPWHTWAEL